MNSWCATPTPPGWWCRPRGGDPSFATTIKGFIRTKLNVDENSDEFPWVVVYYCVRCGQFNVAVAEAAKYANTSQYVDILKAYSKSHKYVAPHEL